MKEEDKKSVRMSRDDGLHENLRKESYCTNGSYRSRMGNRNCSMSRDQSLVTGFQVRARRERQ